MPTCPEQFDLDKDQKDDVADIVDIKSNKIDKQRSNRGKKKKQKRKKCQGQSGTNTVLSLEIDRSDQFNLTKVDIDEMKINIL